MVNPARVQVARASRPLPAACARLLLTAHPVQALVFLTRGFCGQPLARRFFPCVATNFDVQAKLTLTLPNSLASTVLLNPGQLRSIARSFSFPSSLPVSLAVARPRRFRTQCLPLPESTYVKLQVPPPPNVPFSRTSTLPKHGRLPQLLGSRSDCGKFLDREMRC